MPEADERPPAVEIEIPPWKVEVAVVVALIAATTGVEVETTLPFESVESSMFAPVLFKSRIEPAEKARVVPESNVNVPEVYESEASERRKDNESMESKVVASVQLVVTAISLALIVIQVPAPTARAPAVVVSPTALTRQLWIP